MFLTIRDRSFREKVKPLIIKKNVCEVPNFYATELRRHETEPKSPTVKVHEVIDGIQTISYFNNSWLVVWF